MKRAFLLAAIAAVVAVPTDFVSAHCEVPCGIYADQRRFEEMLEDTATIAKAASSMSDIASRIADGPSIVDINQISRWVATKESHATNTQHIIAQYFMTQRIKPSSDNYEKKLTAAHAVMVAAMKCKQTADNQSATTLKKAILDFYRAYEGKEPDFHSH